jgi:hypothetical protein
MAGKIDAIVKLADGRLAVLEYKTSGEDIGVEADYWLRLRCDPQISLYLLGARALGFDVSTVLYDVTRKPTIRLRKEEVPEQYGERLLADTGDRPDYYFSRREVPRREDELVEFRLELWQQAQQLRDAYSRPPWPSAPSPMGPATASCCSAPAVSGRPRSPQPPPAFTRVFEDASVLVDPK